MGWFRRRRRADARVVFLSTAGTPVATPSLAPRPVPVPAVPVVPVVPVVPAGDDPCVRLGFVDGTEVTLGADDPAAREILAAADALAMGHSAERPNGR